MKHKILIHFLSIIGLCLVACKKESIDPWKNFTPFTTSYQTDKLSKSVEYVAKGVKKGELSSLNEVSGLARSAWATEGLWAHNDSGNPNIISLISKNDGETMAKYRLTGLVNEDWEDIESGPGPKEGTTYIYLADIGDNKQNRPTRTIYRFPEPLYTDANKGQIINFKPEVDKIVFKYPEGPQNAETLLLDPWTKDLYVVTKYGIQSKLYVAKYPQKTNEVITLEKVGTFSFRMATGGDISKDGTQIVIKNLDQIFYWKRGKNQPLWQLLAENPELLPYNGEPQGEAFVWDGKNYYTSSEKKDEVNPVLYMYAN